jgi:glycine cleavage system transcriptional repressor
MPVNMAQLIISAVGPDRSGLVGELTSHLHSAGASILDSRMVNFRGQFAMLILLECDADASRKFESSLQGVGRQMGLNLFIAPQVANVPTPHGLPYRLKTYSMDQPGIVAKITGVLRKHGVNIEDLVAHQQSAAFAGSMLFVTEMELTVPATLPIRQLRSELDIVCNELNCDLDLEPAGE